jgi:hypothetical protein
MKDFRYDKDGELIEGFQLTPASRYQEKNWPEWMNSNWLMTIDGEEWLNINDVEARIPDLGWIVKMPDGSVTAVPHGYMETADKVVKEEAPSYPEAKVDEEALLLLGSKLTGKSVDELRAEQTKTIPAKPMPARESPPEPDPLPVADTGLLTEAAVAYELMDSGQIEAGMDMLQKACSRRVAWCNCPPGNCGGGEVLGCRLKSPLQ